VNAILIDSESFMFAALGGALIGVSAVLLLWLNGRILGVSGLVGGLLAFRGDDRTMRFGFLAGAVIAGLFGAALAPTSNPGAATSNTLLLIAAGFAVGLGTRVGSGCTSGHGVCGLARLSMRSLAATITFMVAGIITVFIVRQVAG
jgi:hypothetical protein